MTARNCVRSLGVLFFSFALSLGAWAESARVFELKPARGYARPPLHVNITPSAATYYTPAQIRHAYGFDQLQADGTGQKIAIVDAYGNASIQSDLNTFCTQFGLPATTVTILGPNSSADTGWALETALDVEWAHAIAPRATIILSVAQSASDFDLLRAVAAATNAGATVVSMSWGGSEFSGESAYDPYFQAAGVTFVASSGDSGELSGRIQVEWPAVSPYVVGVGGTSLQLDANNNRASETAWSSSGGGLSTVYARPVWQNTWSGYSYRGVPDVSYNADPDTGVLVYDAVNGGWFIVGGTSAGAPQWAATIALANQSRSAGLAGNPDIYKVAGSAPNINPAAFYDITSGSNGGDADDKAGTGYDLVTGLGSPLANALVPALAPLKPDFSLSMSPSSQTVAAGRVSGNYTVTITSTNGFTGTVKLDSGGLPAGSTYTFNPVSVGGSGSSILSVMAPGGTAAGVYPFTITATSDSVGHTGSATLVVGPPPAPIPISPNTPGQSATPYYTFNTVPGATSYTIFLWDYATESSTVFGPLTPAQVDFGTSGQGRFLQPTALADGTYTWVVSASNAVGTSPWSIYMTFIVGTVPDAPIPISPNTPGQGATPYYTFNTVPGATSYTIFLWDYATESSTVFGPLTPAQVDFGTPGQGRFLQPTALAVGTYTWVVSASNAVGTSPWSIYMTFNVGP